MIKSIEYFEKKCIKKFEELENNFMREPDRLAEYVLGLTDELHKLGLEMIRESLEEMNTMIRKSQKRLRHWVVEAHDTKELSLHWELCVSGKHYSRTGVQVKAKICWIVCRAEKQRGSVKMRPAKMLEEAVHPSYRRGGEAASLDRIEKADREK